MQIRDARAEDIPGILAIYHEAADSSTTIFSNSAETPEERLAWMQTHQQAGFPVLVALDDDQQVIGYASYSAWRPYTGFRHTVEHRVYVMENRRRSGIGRALVETLIQRAQAAEKHVMIATIESENRPSVHMHQQLGFTYIGNLREVGCKFGQWRDVTLMQRILPPAAGKS